MGTISLAQKAFMLEPGDREPSLKPVSADNDPELGEKFLGYFKEKTILQPGFLERKEWQEKLTNALIGGRVLVAIIDLVGSGKLVKEGKFSDRMEAVIRAINSWREKEDQKNSSSPATLGRRIEIRKRGVGEDEILIFTTLEPNENSLTLLESLKREIVENDGHDAAYIGGSENAQGVETSCALRGADIALKKTKEEARGKEGEKQYPPKILKNNGTSASMDNLPVAPEKLIVTSFPFPENVTFKNPLEELKNLSGEFTVISPSQMKTINSKRGMAGGDIILSQLANDILGLLRQKGEPETKIYKIGTVFVIPKVDFSQDELNSLSITLPYGLSYSEVEKQ